MSETPPAKGSTIRGLTGAVALGASLIVLPVSFVMMVRALEATGYGSEAVTNALMLMAAGGGLLGLGIALLIWELSVRYDVRH